MSLYPIALNLTGQRVVVVGFGQVGQRKAERLVAAGADVVAVDPVAAPPVEGVRQLVETFRPDHLDGAVLVFAASVPEVNRQVIAAARARGVLVNSASDPEDGDFTLPALWRSGRLTLAISTEGSGPAFAAAIRDLASSAITPEILSMAELLAEFRPLALAEVSDPEQRRRLLLSWGSLSWLDRIQVEGLETVRQIWRKELDQAGLAGRARDAND